MIPEAEEAKKQGNDCAKDGKYLEALLHYSKAIQLAPQNAALYSNRSLMLLKVQQYYNGMQDALMAIKLNSTWEKGYFRLGEIQHAAERYQEAVWTYKQALQIAPDDEKLKDCIKKSTKELKEQNKRDSRYPIYGIGCGFLGATVIIIANEVISEKSAVESDILKILLVLALTIIGYGLGVSYRYIIKKQRASLLEPPIDLLPDMSPKEKKEATETQSGKTRTRRSQASARQRMKNAKS